MNQIKYINGNYQVTIYPDGTKVRTTPDDCFAPVFPETLDVNISNKCPHGCKFCYIDAKIDGKHGNLNLPIFDSLGKGTEIAINYADHPDLVSFLNRMEKQGVVVSMTINAKDLRIPERLEQISLLVNSSLIKGLGVSIKDYATYRKLPGFITNYPNTVYHIINGIFNTQDLIPLSRAKVKLLVLGYKTKGRGTTFTTTNNLSEPILEIILENQSIISFDNLALDQLKIRNIVAEQVWADNYMGEEGQFSMYIDAVAETSSTSSTEPITNTHSIKDNVIDTFKQVRTTHD